jgi:hypothetical protein
MEFGGLNSSFGSGRLILKFSAKTVVYLSKCVQITLGHVCCTQCRESDKHVELSVKVIKKSLDEEMPSLECETFDGTGDFGAQAGVHYVRARQYVNFNPMDELKEVKQNKIRK